MYIIYFKLSFILTLNLILFMLIVFVYIYRDNKAIFCDFRDNPKGIFKFNLVGFNFYLYSELAFLQVIALKAHCFLAILIISFKK